MDARSSLLLHIRPVLDKAKVYSETSPNESFQNITLRPIIKFQNDLFLSVFKNYIKKHKNAYHRLDDNGKLKYIENAAQKDVKLRNAIKGMVIGHFSVEEYETYILNSSALNKRMVNMVVERLKDQMLYFDEGQLAS